MRRDLCFVLAGLLSLQIAWAQPVLTAANSAPTPGVAAEIVAFRWKPDLLTEQNGVWTLAAPDPETRIQKIIYQSCADAGGCRGPEDGRVVVRSFHKSEESIEELLVDARHVTLGSYQHQNCNTYKYETADYMRFPFTLGSGFEGPIQFHYRRNDTAVTYSGKYSVHGERIGHLQLPSGTYPNVLEVIKTADVVLKFETPDTVFFKSMGRKGTYYYSPGYRHWLLHYNEYYRIEKNGDTDYTHGGWYLNSYRESLHQQLTAGVRLSGGPNPAGNFIDLMVSGSGSSFELSLEDLTGRRVSPSRTLAFNNGGAQTRLAVSDLPSGLYLIRVKGDGWERVEKWMVNH